MHSLLPLTLALATGLCLAIACSPRDFLTRRLASDLISQSEAFRGPQMFWLATGVVSNKDFNSPDSMVLQKRGWIIGTQVKCPAGIEPPPCWDVALSPLGVGVIRPLIPTDQDKGPFSIEAAQRALDGIAGVSKAGNWADVDFTWHWVPMNPLGSALYDGGVRYRSTVSFRSYDDGWRVVGGAARTNQTMDEALRKAEPVSP